MDLSKNWLIEQYVKSRKTAYQLAKELQCSHTIIYYYLKKYKIKRRTISESGKGISRNRGKNNPFYGKKHTKKHFDAIARGEKHPCFIDGRSLKKNHCIDCNKEINWKSIRCQSCASVNKWEKGIYIKSQMLSRNLKPNQIEKELAIMLNELFLNEYKYVGDGKIIIGRFCPDFININGQKKIIELYGDYWHNQKDAKIRDIDRIRTYKKYGYKTLIIWENELKDINLLKNKILEFSLEVI